MKRILCIAVSMALMGCATAPVTTEKDVRDRAVTTTENGEAPIHTEQEEKSLELFTQILNITESSDDRQAILPEIEELYNRIINEYPDVPLVQESYWKLITIYVNDYNPPNYGKAEQRYKEFLEKYPQSVMRRFIEETLGSSYHKHQQWNNLLGLTEYSFDHYVKDGLRPQPSLVFLYAEANYHLGNFIEAERAYKTIVELFPNFLVGRKSAMMLEILQGKS